MDDLKLSVGIEVEGSQAQRALNNLSSRLDSVEKEFEKVKQGMANLFNEAAQASGNYTEKVNTAASAVQGVDSAQKNVGNTNAWKNLAQQIAAIIVPLSEVQMAISEMASIWEDALGPDDEETERFRHYEDIAAGIKNNLEAARDAMIGMSNTSLPSGASSGTNKVKATSGSLGGTEILGAILGAQGIFALIQKILQKCENFQEALDELFTLAADIVTPMINLIAGGIQGIVNAIYSILGIEKKNEKNTASTSKSLAGFDTINNLSSGSSNSDDSYKDKTGMAEALMNLITGLYEVIKGTIVSIVGILGTAFVAIVDAVMAIINTIIMAIELAITTIVLVIDGALAFISGIVAGIVTAGVEFFKGIFNALVKLFTGDFEGCIQALRDMVKNMLDGFVKGFTVFWNSITSFFKPVLDWLEKAFYTTFDFAVRCIKDLGQDLSKVWDFTKTGLNWIISGFEKLVNGFIGMINAVINTINKIFGINIGRLGYASIPRLAVGTNYVANDGLAYLHQGEAVVPKKFNSGEFFGGNDEIVSVLMDIKNIVQSKEFKTYISQKEIGKAAVNYINTQNRIVGGSLV